MTESQISKQRKKHIEEVIAHKSKRFLMEQYTISLVADLEEAGAVDPPLDDLTVEALLVARSQVSDVLVNRIDKLLEAHTGGAAATDDETDSEEGIFDEDGENGEEGEEGKKRFKYARAQKIAYKLDVEDSQSEEEEMPGFAVDNLEREETPDLNAKRQESAEETPGFEGESGAEEDGEFADEELETDGNEPDATFVPEEQNKETAPAIDHEDGGKPKNELLKQKKLEVKSYNLAVKESLGNDTQEFEPEEQEPEEESPGFVASEAKPDETPGFEPTLRERDETPGFEPTEQEPENETPGFEPTLRERDETPGFEPTLRERDETPGFEPTEQEPENETPGFEPTLRERDETPGFEPTEQEPENETPGFEPTLRERDETPGFEPTEQEPENETPGFEPTLRERDETPGFEPTEQEPENETPGFEPTLRERDETPGFEPTEQEPENETPGFEPTEQLARDEKSGMKRPDPELEKAEKKHQRIQRSDQQTAKEKRKFKREEATLAEDNTQEAELDLSNIRHDISLEEIEHHLGLTILPADREKLNLKLQQMKLDTSIKNLLANKKTMAHGYVLIPRVFRLFNEGQTTPINLVYLVRNFANLFENVSQVIEFKSESFFTQQTPELEWAIISCEVLPKTLNQNYMQQRLITKDYAREHNANALRVHRRSLVEALYDLVLIQTIKGEKLLAKTIELTDTKVRRQNLACVNFGEKGIRVSDVTRAQTDPQMGFCPSW